MGGIRGELGATWVILTKEIRVEWRSREVWFTGVFFSLLLAVLFLFGLATDAQGSRGVGPGVLWIGVVFLASIAFGRSFVREHETRCLDALRLVPSVCGPLFWGKCLGNGLVLFSMELVLVWLVAAIFPLPGWSLWPALLWVLLLGTLGLCSLGTVISAALARFRLREVLLPLVLYPLIIPLLIGGVKATGALVEGEMSAYWDWANLVVAFDAVFLVLSRWLFGKVIEAVE
ncbi:MAG: heme exporter protein CcmB [Bradymonadales bacterium]|nr:heme exporter protein CcmB [Bradymonadales bacterium]